MDMLAVNGAPQQEGIYAQACQGHVTGAVLSSGTSEPARDRSTCDLEKLSHFSKSTLECQASNPVSDELISDPPGETQFALSPGASSPNSEDRRCESQVRSSVNVTLSALACPGEITVSPELNIAVIGGLKSGKSLFVKNALDLKDDNSSTVITKKVSLEGSISIVRLIEIDMARIPRGADASDWITSIEDIPTAGIHGALLLFDVTNRKSVNGLGEILSRSADTFSDRKSHFILR